MDKLSFPETLTREMSEIIARNPRKYAHLTLDVELDNPDDVCEYHAKNPGKDYGSCCKSSSSNKLKREILLDKRGDLRWANQMRASYRDHTKVIVEPKLSMVSQPLMESFRISRDKEKWRNSISVSREKDDDKWRISERSKSIC